MQDESISYRIVAWDSIRKVPTLSPQLYAMVSFPLYRLPGKQNCVENEPDAWESWHCFVALKFEQKWVYRALVFNMGARSIDQCCICLDARQHRSFSRIPCGHIMHHECLEKWKVSGNPSCPICRYRINRYDSSIFRRQLISRIVHDVQIASFDDEWHNIVMRITG